MFKRDSVKGWVAWITVLLAVLTLAWRGGAKIEALDQNVYALTEFRSEQALINKDQVVMNQKTTEKLTRVETMMEMVVKGMGMNPPPRRRSDR